MDISLGKFRITGFTLTKKAAIHGLKSAKSLVQLGPDPPRKSLFRLDIVTELRSNNFLLQNTDNNQNCNVLTYLG